MGIENQENVEQTLQYIKNKYQLNPELITIDFSPAMVSAVTSVFGEKVIQIDPFHVMQELNRGIRRDVLDYKYLLYRKDIQIYNKMRSNLSSFQSSIETNQLFTEKDFKNQIPLITLSTNIRKPFSLIKKWIGPLNVSDPQEFTEKINNLLSQYQTKQTTSEQVLAKTIQTILPKRAMSVKGMNRAKILILRKFKSYIRSYRQDLEQQEKKFHQDYWILFKQPEKMTDQHQKLLSSFLKKYPDLQVYRDLTIHIGSLYRTPVNKLTGYELDELPNRPTFSDKLQTALTTIRKFKDSILRFVTVSKAHPEIIDESWVAMEYINRNFKAPFKKGLNLTSHLNLKSKLALQMKCEVRFFVS